MRRYATLVICSAAAQKLFRHLRELGLETLAAQVRSVQEAIGSEMAAMTRSSTSAEVAS